VTEELLAKGVSKLYKMKASTPPDNHAPKKAKISSTSNDSSFGAKEGSLRRVLLIRDRKTTDSWRYGFAEFSSVEDAQAAMAKYKATEKFTISSKPVLVSYIHAGVFVPVLHPSGEDFIKFTFSPLSNASVKLMYWDETAYASEFITEPVHQPSTIKTKESEHAKLAAAAANEGLLSGGESRAKKRKVEKEAVPSNKKVVAPHLQFWTSRHAEIHGLPPKEAEEATADSTSSSPKKTSDDGTDPPSQSFADMERKCCLLCSRQFKTEAEVNKHERISQLHRDNMKNPELVTKAQAKLKKSASREDAADSSAYRDRAKERRQAFNQPKQPAAQHRSQDDKPSNSKKEDKESTPPPQSKGAALLGKMGWTAGEGLGAQGTGRTEAITTELYAQGVGLGAQGGKVGDAVEEAQRQTKGSYKDFLNKTKDKAKERFESMA